MREQEYRDGKVSFPSLRINDTTIIDLMVRDKAPGVRKFTGGASNAGGTPINHLCRSMNATEYEAVSARLARAGVPVKSGGDQAFGAQGPATESIYFKDPDGNVIEARHYA